MSLVSIIIPCYNEEKTIGLLLDAICRQDYPMQDMEVVIADGLSIDRTRQVIADYQNSHPQLSIKVIDNPKRLIPCALNLAIAASTGEYILRLDAHSIPYPDYVSNSVRALAEGRGDNVGGVWEIRPSGKGWMARSIAVAAAHRLGAGDARYRHTHTSQEVDTVPFGAFRRILVDKIGGYDETLQTNEDYEFNVRVRQSGGKVWQEASIRSVYFARSDLPALARQYGRYGFWKARMLLRYPASLRWRQALPPLFILSILLLCILSIFVPVFAWMLTAELLIYFLALVTAATSSAIQKRDPALAAGLVLAIATMHISWGVAFIWSLFLSLIDPHRKSR